MSDSKEDVRVAAGAASDGTTAEAAADETTAAAATDETTAAAWWKVVHLMRQQAALQQAARDEAAATAGGDSAVTTAAAAGDERTATAGGDSAVTTAAVAGDETTGGWSWSLESWQSWLQLGLMWQELWKHLEMLKECKVWSEQHEKMQQEQMQIISQLQAEQDDADARLIGQTLLHEEELRKMQNQITVLSQQVQNLRQQQQDDRAMARQRQENTHEEFQLMQRTLEHLQRRQLPGQPDPSSSSSSWSR